MPAALDWTACSALFSLVIREKHKPYKFNLQILKLCYYFSLYDELKEIEDNPFRDEENEEDSIISHEEQGSIPVGAASHFVKKAFYIPSLKFYNLTKKDSVEQSEAFDWRLCLLLIIPTYSERVIKQFHMRKCLRYVV